jgi:hypothetical protein
MYFGLMLGDIDPEPHKNLRDHNCGFNFSIFYKLKTFFGGHKCE